MMIRPTMMQWKTDYSFARTLLTSIIDMYHKDLQLSCALYQLRGRVGHRRVMP
jgi:hypothetical protein